MNITQIAFGVVLTCFVYSCKDDAVQPASNNPARPMADFNLTGERTAPAQIAVQNLSLNSKSYQWDFGNGVTSISPQPNNIFYSKAGTYEISLTAINGTLSHSIKKTIIITQGLILIAKFSFDYQNGQIHAPATILFNNE